MKLVARIEKSFSFWFLLAVSILFTLLRWPSILEPYWYGDEGIYQAVGILINHGAPLYSGAWDNKPPLLYVLYAIFNSDQFIVRSVSLIFGLASIWVFYFVARKLFPKHKYASEISTIVYALAFGTRLIEGNIANAENFMLLPILLGALLIVSGEGFKKSIQFKSYLLAGFLLSLAFLTKIVAVFDFMAFTFFILVDPEKDLKNKFLKKAFPFILGFSLPILTAFAYFFFTNNFKDFTTALFFSNVGYVGHGNQFIVPQGLLYLKSGLLGAFLLFIFWKRNKINKNIIFISVWFAFSLFDVFFAQRSYTHYLIMLLPSFCLMIGAVIFYKKERIFLFTFLAAGFLAISYTFSFKGKFVKYYANFANFYAYKKNINSYQSFFDGNTPRDYELAQYIKSNTSASDSIFVWGNNAQIYKLADKTPIMRYTVAYHITGFPPGMNDLINAIENKKPKLIIVMPNVPDFPLPLTDYNEKIDIHGAKVYEKVL